MTGQRWTIKEAAEALGLSEKTVRRRIKDGTLKAEQTKGKYGVEYRITSLEDALQPDGDPDMEKGVDFEKSLALEKYPDVEGDNILAKALDIIKALQEENARLAAQFTYLQSQVLELEGKLRLLTEPKKQAALVAKVTLVEEYTGDIAPENEYYASIVDISTVLAENTSLKSFICGMSFSIR